MLPAYDDLRSAPATSHFSNHQKPLLQPHFHCVSRIRLHFYPSLHMFHTLLNRSMQTLLRQSNNRSRIVSLELQELVSHLERFSSRTARWVESHPATRDLNCRSIGRLINIDAKEEMKVVVIHYRDSKGLTREAGGTKFKLLCGSSRHSKRDLK